MRRPTRPRAVLYLRLSEADDASTSITRQEADLRARAEREGWDVVEVRVDDGISGRKTRENAEHALAMLRDGRADVLAVWKFDRWSRQGLSALAALIDTLDSRPDALFVADRDGLASSQPAWRIIAAVLAEVARMEAENTQTRVRSSIAALRRARRFAGGTVGYGYRPAPAPDGPGRILVVDPDEAAIVREAAERILSGEAPWRVCLDLNERAVAAPRSEFRRKARAGEDTTGADLSTWRAQSLRRLLTSRHVLGQVVHRGEVVRGSDGLPETVWDPILDVDSWHRLRARLLPDEPGEPKRNRRPARLLSGLVRCAHCGARMHVRHGGANGALSYGCPARANGEACPSPRVSCTALEAHVVETVLATYRDVPVVEERTYSTGSSGASLAEVEAAISETTAALGDDGADVPALLSRLEVLKARRSEIRDAPATTTTVLVPTGQTYAEALASDDVDQARAALSRILSEVLVSSTTSGRRFSPERASVILRDVVGSEVAASNLLSAFVDDPEAV